MLLASFVSFRSFWLVYCNSIVISTNHWCTTNGYWTDCQPIWSWIFAEVILRRCIRWISFLLSAQGIHGSIFEGNMHCCYYDSYRPTWPSQMLLLILLVLLYSWFPYSLLIILTTVYKFIYVDTFRVIEDGMNQEFQHWYVVNSSQDIQNMLLIHLAKFWIYIFSVFMHLWVPAIFWTSVVKPFHHMEKFHLNQKKKRKNSWIETNGRSCQ